MNLVAKITYDDAPENPTEWSIFDLYSFNRRHSSFVHPDEIDLDRHSSFVHPDEIDLDRVAASTLSYFEHGLCRWSRAGNRPLDYWDTVSVGGILQVKDEPDALAAWSSMDEDARTELVDSFLEQYTAWANGEVYVVEILDTDVKDCDCCKRPLEPAVIAEPCGGIYDVSAWIAEELVGKGLEGTPVEERHSFE